MSYVSAAGMSGAAMSSARCVFCDALAAGYDRRALILHRGVAAFLILNAFPYASGHLMAVVTRHVGSLEEAAPAELAESMQLVQSGVRALQAAYRPDGFNVGLNQGRVAGAGVLGHLHVHEVPRWNGDANFMPVIADTRVLPETLDTTYDRLRAALGS
jgi:ATP adenylyltransferase